MGFHHLAIATRDAEANHAFYTESMGFTLDRTVVAPTDTGGWARHLFYDTGNGEMIAFWDLHDDTIGDFEPSISTGLGPSTVARPRPLRLRDRSRLVHVDLHDGPERDHGRVLHHHGANH